eukprot:12230979-Karenia_brevis.AAC.1
MVVGGRVASEGLPQDVPTKATRWRRPADAPILRSGFYTQMLATRCESQIGADWMCVPAARNLHW